MIHPLPRLHAVTNDDILTRPDFLERASTIVRAGPVALHVRGRTTHARRLAEIATRLVAAGAFVVINDRVDVALGTAAAGIHAPETGLPTAAIRGLVGTTLYVGRSTHSPRAARVALDGGADYVFLGPIWPTPTHPETPPLGPTALTAAERPRVLAIGGVSEERVAPSLAAGAWGVAVVTALWHAADPGAAAQALLLSLKEHTA